MRIRQLAAIVLTPLLFTACIKRGPNPVDPYESINRPIHKFNMAVDATILKPPARAYKAIVPGPIKKGIDNFYRNLHMLPSVANDLLQAQWKHSIRDSWRFLINSTLGLGGTLDVATGMGLPEHYNDLGLTFAKWGDTKSPYVVIPLLGPSTVRDGFGELFDFSLFMPYPYLDNYALIYGLLGLRYIDLRAQYLDSEKLMNEALDPYAFIRDAYMQSRNFQISGKEPENIGSFYVDEEELGDYIDDDSEASQENATTPTNDTKAKPNVASSPVSA